MKNHEVLIGIRIEICFHSKRRIEVFVVKINFIILFYVLDNRVLQQSRARIIVYQGLIFVNLSGQSKNIDIAGII